MTKNFFCLSAVSLLLFQPMPAQGSAAVSKETGATTFLLPDGPNAIKFILCAKIAPSTDTFASLTERAAKSSGCRVIAEKVTQTSFLSNKKKSLAQQIEAIKFLQEGDQSLKPFIDQLDSQTAEHERDFIFGMVPPKTELFVHPFGCSIAFDYEEEVREDLYFSNEVSRKRRSVERDIFKTIKDCKNRLTVADSVLLKKFEEMLAASKIERVVEADQGRFFQNLAHHSLLLNPSENEFYSRVSLNSYTSEKASCVSGVKFALEKLTSSESGRLKLDRKLKTRLHDMTEDLRFFLSLKESGLASCRYLLSRLDGQVGFLSVMAQNDPSAEAENARMLRLAQFFENALPPGFVPNGYEKINSGKPGPAVIPVSPGSGHKFVPAPTKGR